MNKSWRARSLMLLVCAALALSACDYEGRPDNAGERRFTWFSYLAGEDLKESYRAHAPPRYRFIYNAIYSEQVRTYEINGLPDGGGGMIDAEVLSAEVSPDFLVHFPFWPWSGKRAVAELNDVEMKLLRTSLEASGFFDSPPRSARFSTLIRSIGWSAPVRATASTSMPGPIRRRNSPTCASLKSCAALTAPRSHSRKRANCRPTKKSSAPSRQLRKMSGPAISAFLPRFCTMVCEPPRAPRRQQGSKPNLTTRPFRGVLR